VFAPGKAKSGHRVEHVEVLYSGKLVGSGLTHKYKKRLMWLPVTNGLAYLSGA